MPVLNLILMIVALLCFLLAAIGVKTPRDNDLVAVGLFFYVLAVAIAGAAR